MSVTPEAVAALVPILEDQSWTEELDPLLGLEDPDDDEVGTVRLALEGGDYGVLLAIVDEHPDWDREQVKTEMARRVQTPADGGQVTDTDKG